MSNTTVLVVDTLLAGNGTGNATISSSSPFALASYLKAALPPVSVAGELIYVSDATGKYSHVGSLVVSNASSWNDTTTGNLVV